jgi:adenylate cyclase
MRERTLCLLSADLAGFARACNGKDALAIAQFLDDWYRSCAPVITSRGGRIVKFMGDAVLAVFAESAAAAAVDCARDMRAHRWSWPVELGANVHVATVADGDFGPDDDKRYDVFGHGVNQLFMMGGGPGIRVSEPVHRQLADDVRGACTLVDQLPSR